MPASKHSQPQPPEDARPQIHMRVEPGQPIRFAPGPAVPPPKESPYAPLGKTLRAYRDSAKQLLEDRYPDLRVLTPPHLQGLCSCVAAVCEDAVVLRWDQNPDESPKVRIVVPQAPYDPMVEFWAPTLSDRYVYCPNDVSTFVVPADAPQIQFLRTSPGSQPEVVGQAPFGIVVTWDKTSVAGIGTVGRPVPVASLLADMEVVLHIEAYDATAEPKPGTGQQALLRQQFRLPVGWSAFEVYPKLDLRLWTPQAAAAWAETDLLAIAARHSLREQAYHALDPRAAARRQYWNLLDEFEGLLGGNEGDLQAFLTANPALLSPTHVKAWPKVPLGGRVTDFILRDATGDFLLVELEAPTRRLFRNDGQQHEDLTHAVDQVTNWIRYLEDNLSTVQREIGLSGISTSPQSLIVIGRSTSLTEPDRRKLKTIQNMVPKLQILTYDQLLATAEAAISNLLGPRLIKSTAAQVYYIWNNERQDSE